ncbi:MAG: signal peptide peptidase SppA [Flammeovirgaceae bacterium]|nr:MAG: signal peptide peptidase SppA [Flammeovirgaceae bacterium]
MNFFKTFLASMLALTVFSIISVVLFFMVLGVLSADEKVVLKNNTVLHLKLDAEITEQQVENPFEGMPVFGNEIPTIGLLQLKEAIKHAAADDKIAGIYLDVNYPMAGFATIEEIRQSLMDFKASGKWIVAYSEVMSEKAYYLASVADRVYLNPEGELEFNGLTVEISFFKRLFDKLEIKPEIFRVGDYKSAVEPYLLDKMSNENRLQLTELVHSIYGYMLNQISKSRNVPVDQLKTISDKMLARNARLSQEYGLVDSLLYYDEVLNDLRKRLNLNETEKINTIGYKRYSKSYTATGSSPNEIAVIVADGAILPGKADEGVIGSETFAETIRKARENKRVKAIVLRINSPGGSFQASDVMWREVTLAAKQKPVIASMSDYAASGGYYLAMGCDTIVAQPHTITGSIGVFSVLFDASGFLGNKLGITFDEVNTGEYGEMVTLSRPLTPGEKNVWQQRTEEIYETFTGKAALGRNISKDQIKQVASGRVWTGQQAKDRQLVDVLGGYEQALAIAADAAGLGNDYKVRYYPARKSIIEQFLGSLEDNAKTQRLKQEMGAYYVVFKQWQVLRQHKGVQARMPFELQIN